MYRLQPDQQAALEKLQPVLDNVIAVQAEDVDTQGRFPSEAMAALGEAGLLGLTIPTELGGMGQTMRVAAAVVDEIAQRCASTAMVAMMHYAGVNCYLANTERFTDILRAAAAGRHLSTLAFSEKGSRSQFWAPVSKAVPTADGKGVVYNAEKSWVTSAGHADGIVCSAGSDDGESVTVFAVLKDDPGLTISGGWNSLGMRGNQSNPMTMTDVELDYESRLIGEIGKGPDIMLGRALPIFQVCQGAIGVGIAESAFKAAQGHITSQGFQHTGTKLSDLPNLRASLARMRIETDKARAYVASALDKAESEAPDAMLHLLAVKESSGETAVTVTDLAMRSCGGAAFSKHLGLERAFRDARAAIVMAPTTDVLREFVGRALVNLPLFG